MVSNTPERGNRLLSSTVVTKSPASITTLMHKSPIHKRTSVLLNRASPSKRNVSGTSTTSAGGASGAGTATSATATSASAAPSQLSKEAARYAKQLQALAGGWASSSSVKKSSAAGTSNSSSISSNSSSGGSGRAGFLSSGTSVSRFAASATAGAGRSFSSSSLLSTPVLKDSNKDNINNNNNPFFSVGTSTPSTPRRDDSSNPRTSGGKSSFLALLTASTPKSVLGKRSSSVAGIVPTTPAVSSAAPSPLPSPFVSSSLLGLKTPTSTTPALSSLPGDSKAAAGAATGSLILGVKSTSPRRRSFGRVASAGPSVPKSMAAQAASSLTRTISSGGLTTKLEVVTNDWLGSGSSPKKGRKVYNQGDRFIPNRSATNMANAQAKLEMVRHPPFSGSTAEATDEATIAYNHHIAEACGINLDSRMLAFSAEPPTLDDTTSRDGSSAIRKIYGRHPSFTRSTSSSSLLVKKRTILTSPDKVLDAPGLMDDYYLNLLDWSCSNMVAIGLDKSVFIWDAELGHAESLFTLPGNTDAIASVSWAYDGLYLAVGTFDGDTQIWDIETKTKVRSMTGHVSRVGVLAWDKHILSSGCRDGSIWNHDVRVQNHKVAELKNHTNEVCGLAWRADGQQLASGGNDNLVNVWDARSLTPKYTKSNHTAAVKALAWCPWQNNLLASGGGTYDKQIHFWNTTTGARVNTLNTGSQVTSIVWSTEYKEFMSSHGYPDNNISVYGYPSMNRVIDIPAHDSRILHTALSPDGQTVATVASDENLKFWKLFEKRPGSGGKKDGSKSATGKRPLARSGSFCRLGDEDDDDRTGPGGGGSGGYQGTMVKGKSISSMTRIR